MAECNQLTSLSFKGLMMMMTMIGMVKSALSDTCAIASCGRNFRDTVHMCVNNLPKVVT